jgi:hypothetical protein
VVVPVWVRSRLNGINVPEDECRNGNVTADDHDGSEAIFQRRMGVFEMKNVVADFLLDDT